MNPIKKTIELADGRTITLETGKLAKQADGAVELRMGNTMLLATVVSAKEAGEGVDFMPLQVEYKEKFSSAGRFPGGFLKREGRASDYEVLTARLVDRVLRPLFPDNYHADTFVNITMYSSDGVDMPDALAGLAASAAIAVSDIPFNGPISEVRVARIDGEFVINPTFEQLERADMELMVGATYDNIMMVEGEMDEVSEADLLAALKAAHDAIKVQCKAQIELAEMAGKTVKREYCHEVNDEELRADVKAKCYDKAYAIAKAGCADKHWRQDSFDAICDEYIESLPEEEREEKAPLVKRYYHDVEKEAVRRCILDEGIRLDGRKTTEIRPIWCEVDYIPGPHGSAVFTRGETQSLSTVTLGTKLDEKILDDVLNQGRMAQQKETAELMRVLSHHRRILLDAVHQNEKRIDCLDYLIYHLVHTDTGDQLIHQKSKWQMATLLSISQVYILWGRRTPAPHQEKGKRKIRQPRPRSESS